MNISTIFIIECIGMASFSISGTIIAVQKRLDFIGAIFFSLITCFGGGLIRDLIIGVTPPLLFTSFEFRILTLICVGTSTLIFMLSFIKGFAATLLNNVHNFWIELTDSIGLAAFCVAGVDSALASNADKDNFLLLVFCGCITGVGGGILRDVLSCEIPLLFRKHIYLIPAIIGTVVYVFMLPIHSSILAYCVSMGIILIIRILALIFHWNLPTPLEKREKKKRQ